MRLWQRHTALALKARREGRTVHRHRWRQEDDRIGERRWFCETCPKVVTAWQVLACGRDGYVDLFLPIVEEQLDELARGAMART